MKQVICCASGKSGGHIIPNLRLALQRSADTLVFISSDTALDIKLLKSNPDVAHHIPLHITPLKKWYRLPLVCISLTWAIIKSMTTLYKIKPTVVLSTGGIVAVPVCIAAWILRIPIELYELNAVPGKAIRAIAPLASKIHVCFLAAKHHFKHTTFIPYPIRFEPSRTITITGFQPKRKTIMILGGSQGSQTLNKYIQQTIEQFPDTRANIQIIHQYGNDTKDWNAYYAQYKIPSITMAFTNNIQDYYPYADIIMCRSGAGTLFETLHFKKPCITIPLTYGGDGHQRHNAQEFQTNYPSFYTVLTETDLQQSITPLYHALMQK